MESKEIGSVQNKIQIGEQLLSMLYSGTENDNIVQLHCRDGITRAAHRVVLEMVSKFCADRKLEMLNEKKLRLPFSSKVIDKVLQFIYHSNIPVKIDADDLIELYAASRKLALSELATALSPILLSSMGDLIKRTDFLCSEKEEFVIYLDVIFADRDLVCDRAMLFKKISTWSRTVGARDRTLTKLVNATSKSMDEDLTPMQEVERFFQRLFSKRQ